MSHKRAKHKRKVTLQLLNALAPIADRALEQLNGDFEAYDKWALLVAPIHYASPQTPLEDLLPEQLEATILRIMPQLRKFRPQDIPF